MMLKKQILSELQKQNEMIKSDPGSNIPGSELQKLNVWINELLSKYSNMRGDE